MLLKFDSFLNVQFEPLYDNGFIKYEVEDMWCIYLTFKSKFKKKLPYFWRHKPIHNQRKRIC